MKKRIYRLMSVIVALTLALGSFASAGASSASASSPFKAMSNGASVLAAGDTLNITGTFNVPLQQAGGGIWVSQSEIMSRPTTGAAWNSILSDAAGSWGTASVSNQDSDHDQYVLAGALVCARTGQYCDKTRLALLSAIGTEEGSRWLAVGRNMLGYTIAADVMRNSGNLTGADLTSVSNWLANFLTRTLANNNSGVQEKLTPFGSGSNASAQEGAVYAAIASYTGNTEKLEYVWNRFRLYSCDKAGNPEQVIDVNTGFSSGWSFATTYNEACAVNPKGTTKDGVRIDGALINDMRRGGSFKFPPEYTSYPWVGLEGYVPTALILQRAGYPAFSVKDNAVLRTHEYLCYLKNNTTTDWWDPARAAEIKHLVKVVYGFDNPGCSISYPVGKGRTVGYADWTHPLGNTVITPTTVVTVPIPPSGTPTATATSIPPTTVVTVSIPPSGTPTTTATSIPPTATNNLPLPSVTLPATQTQTVPSTIAPVGQNTIEVRVVKGVDDVEERSTGSVYTKSNDLTLVDERDNQVVGIRFVGVNIPKGAIITNAYLQFKVDEISSGVTTLSIQGEASSNASAFASTTRNVSSRLRTKTAVSWSPASWLILRAMGPDQRTPNLASIVQQIVNQSGWVAGNPVVMIISGSGKRVARAYEINPADAPLLHVEYTMAASLTNFSTLTATAVATGSPTNTATIVPFPTLTPIPLTATQTIFPTVPATVVLPTTSPTDTPFPTTTAASTETPTAVVPAP